jgi:anti-sigma B factor antagonist
VADLVVHFSVDGERSVLRLTGELDLATAPELRMHGAAELAAARCRTLTIDMSGVTFIDSTGLGVLVDLRRMAGVAEIALELTDVPPRVARIIAIAGLADTFGVSSDDAPAG